MEETSLKKFDRIISILIQLQSKKLVKAQDLADKFDVSLRTIYRDVKTLEHAGVPVIGESGTGYSLMEGYKLPPVMFNWEEASSFVAVEKLSEKYLDKTLRGHFQSAITKIKAVLKWSEKEMMDHLDQHIKTSVIDREEVQQDKDVLSALMDAIIHKKQVRVDYWAFESDKSVVRDIEPIGLYHDYHVWYLMAYCHLRGDYRQFRTDRMMQAEVLDEPFLLKHKTLDHFLSTAKKTKSDQQEIVIKVEKKYARYMMSTRMRYGFKKEEDLGDHLLMTFVVDHQGSTQLVRWIMAYMDMVEIIEPVSFKVQIREYIAEIQELIK